MRRTLSFLAVALVVACNSVLDIPEAHLRPTEVPEGSSTSSSSSSSSSSSTGGVKSCADGQKNCNGNCVEKDDPATGCGGESCSPCNTGGCTEDGQCAVDSCEDNFRDCNGDAADGCEVDVTSDRENCSECGTTCDQNLECIDSVCRCHNGDQCGRDGECNMDDGTCICGGEQCQDGAACDRGSCAN